MEPKKPVSLQGYLGHEIADGKNEFRVVAKYDHDTDGTPLQFYIHPLDKNGESRDFSVKGNLVEDVTQWLP